MKFWQIAAAILSLKMLDLFWNLAWLRMSEGFSIVMLFGATVVWLIASVCVWLALRWICEAIANDRKVGP